jgi:hypothetical protein
VKRVTQVLGAVLVLLGLFWAGRESDHGLGAFWEHWWCPIPLAAIVLGAGSMIAARRGRPVA